ncbi:Mediator of RNA polymerase II transcription subunit 6 [Friedmanniomyces endolithicus]|uniref:Mediator of RNA polymerase II transcription subunit 6 n=1 Tax=Friedmanniomyces endolithicus TaxID=329885 RepID=A0A4U0USN5_9PEZI|nr:Mediator of RNA polymerase II transcription subunit 6 [Friedmanniomyces endolithicus]KAK0317253.1 Mediator of RNA polymerase II transcription subunit 6 [Friedmanniomyces endolithicus]KAK0919896.1 Mediator of RNA polymerase II transcription subunit 6 [Friedmanniomyces endolithicus]KAK0971064.1 Mediator of RNA polymerase II transcription subunit 6 [Friedmanniomyces endolithicus]KAK1043619.1 Mediator of RNA polymerase II transcription subunit 6 [Friedmanniomyces endolithicus]
MTAPPPPPLDETISRRQDVVQWWLSDDKNGIPPPPYTWMEERFIHRYFSETPFFDWSTKNGLIFTHAQTNIPAYELVHNRKELEATLKKSPGVEYVISHGSQLVPKGPGIVEGQQSHVWVLRKQERLNEQPPGLSTSANPYPLTETRGSYYIVNESVYQAPSVADVVGNRLLSAVVALEKMFEKAATLPSFAPTTGHTYLPSAKERKTTRSSTAGSTHASPTRSRSASLAPETTQSLRSAPADIASAASASAHSAEDLLATRLLADSLRQTSVYSDDYTDENPLLGEPGNLKFTFSTAAIKKRRAADEAAEKKASEARDKATFSRAGSGSPKPVAEKVKVPTPPPPAVFTEARAMTGKEGRERREERKRRRKSRPGADSATSPTTPKSATGGLVSGLPG